MSLKLITIDFWNTMFDSSNGAKRNQFRLQKLAIAIESFDRKIEQSEFNKAMQASWEYFNEIWIKEMRTPRPKDTIAFFWHCLDLPFDKNIIEKVANEFANSTLEHPPAILPGLKEALAKLSEKYKLAIVSDTGFTPGYALRELLKTNDLIQYFEAFSFSDETLVSKPHPKAFFTILEQLDIEAEEALHIGDIEQTDIAGAKGIGMKAIRYQGDPSAELSSRNTEKTIADFTADSWDETVLCIGKIG
ncbi:MAG: HAD family hydrolase [Ignavibacteria bacterium]|nr:HAD family hydrolase [Ignavibacteria bacterium]